MLIIVLTQSPQETVTMALTYFQLPSLVKHSAIYPQGMISKYSLEGMLTTNPFKAMWLQSRRHQLKTGCSPRKLLVKNHITLSFCLLQISSEQHKNTWAVDIFLNSYILIIFSLKQNFNSKQISKMSILPCPVRFPLHSNYLQKHYTLPIM